MYEELVKALHEHAKPDGWDCSVCMCRNAEDRGFYTCTEELAAKAADAIEKLSKERKTGKWIIKDNPGTGWYRVTCSACGEDVTSTAPVIGFFPNAKITWNYCPECGSYNGGADDVL